MFTFRSDILSVACVLALEGLPGPALWLLLLAGAAGSHHEQASRAKIEEADSGWRSCSSGAMARSAKG